MGYHLHLYEPDVDRDGFDIVVEDDEDTIAWYQTKAVLATTSTDEWDVGVSFLRPSLDEVEDYGFDFLKAGRSGGVILIEIADNTAEPTVTYRYTDFNILAAIADGMLQERPWKGRGRPAISSRDNANDNVATLRSDSPPKVIALPKNVFVTVANPDRLLGVMGLRSEAIYSTFAIRRAYGFIQIEAEGKLLPHDHSISDAAGAHHHLELLCAAQPHAGSKKVTLFDPFVWERLPTG